MNHTPGPWKNHDCTTGIRPFEWHEIEAPDGRVIATLEQESHHPDEKDWTPDEVRANAEFIARACSVHDDLLEACKRLVATAGRLELFHEDWNDIYQAARASGAIEARAIIAKAEGKTP